MASITDGNEKAKLLASLLDGKALTWWRFFSGTASGDIRSLDYDDLVLALREYFADVD